MHDFHQNPGSGPTVAAPLAGLAVLVMEDEPILALDLQMILEDAGASVVGPATTLQNALSLVDTELISCALLDVQMGEQSGLKAAERLQRSGIPLVFHTGNAAPDDLRREWPACPVIIKPASPASIVEALLSLHVPV